MFLRLGRFLYRHRWAVVVLWAVATLLALPLVPRLPGVLKAGGFDDPTLEAEQARRVAVRELGLSPSAVVVVYSSDDLTADEPRFIAEVERSLAALRDLPFVGRITPHTANFRQVSPDRHTAYEIVSLTVEPEAAHRLVGQVEARLRSDQLQVTVAGGPAFYRDIQDVSERDLRRAEFLTFPIALVALLFVFGSFVAAGAPVVVGGVTVAATLAALYLLGQTTDLSIFVMNMVTMLGLGLGTDYSLFIVSRFREELLRRDVPEAVAATVATAGRAVAFSGLTVLIGLAGLLTFRFMMLRSLGVGGILVVALAVLAALTLLPALLGILGERINRLRVRRAPIGTASGGFWERLSGRVMRRPLAFLIPVLGALLLLGVPFLNVRLSLPDASILPSDMPSRRGFDALNRQFGESETSPMFLVVQAPGPIVAPERLTALYDFARAIAADPRVKRVESIVSLDPRLTGEQYGLLYRNPDRIADPFARQVLDALGGRGGSTMIRVITRDTSASAATKALVRDIRATPLGADLRVQVGGGAASMNDIVDRLYTDFPRALVLIVASTYVVLLVLFRSVVLPLKAVAMNSLSILASYGALVVIFQDGALADLLGFTPLGFVEATLPIVMFCILFGLSMDYEVFLLTRVREVYEQTGDNALSVAKGLERSGRVITSAALIVVVVAGSFVTADITLIKALGVGTAIAVFLDATVVRALLVPATMRLLGDWNWWAPPFLRRLLPDTAGPLQEGVSPGEAGS